MLNTITAVQAYQAWREFCSIPVTPISVYWDALDAERDGHITVGMMDAISVFHKAEIVSLYDADQALDAAEARYIAECDAEMSSYWADLEAE